MPTPARTLATLALTLLMAVGLTACTDTSGETASGEEAQGETASGTEATAHLASLDELPEVIVYKSPTCGCCKAWVTHLEENGFAVETRDMMDVQPKKQELGVPAQMASCHTAYADGYVFEGHVPADVMKDFLAEAPDATGLAVPGMPIGSPGMEVEGRPAEAYDVIAFDAEGEWRVYASR